jgi:hypothetical protein
MKAAAALWPLDGRAEIAEPAAHAFHAAHAVMDSKGPAMTRIFVSAVALALVAGLQSPGAQQAPPAADLVSTWTLVSVERGVSGGQITRAQGPRGLLILDAKGHVFEFFDVSSRQEPAAPQADPVRAFSNYGGFWGRYESDPTAGHLRFTAFDGVSPNMQDATFSRSVVVTGERMTMTSIDEPHAHGGTRWTWERVPTVDHLSPLYRQVVGFWRHESEGRINLDTGEITGQTRRAPSVIVYTPGGYVGVHFPTLGRTPFAGDTPTADEAQAALRGYLGYYGTLGVYPGEVFHNLLAGVSPAAGSVLRRSAEIVGDTLTVKLQPLGAGGGRGGARTTTAVMLTRLSGEADMLPRGADVP